MSNKELADFLSVVVSHFGTGEMEPDCDGIIYRHRLAGITVKSCSYEHWVYGDILGYHASYRYSADNDAEFSRFATWLNVNIAKTKKLIRRVKKVALLLKRAANWNVFRPSYMVALVAMIKIVWKNERMF